MTLLDHAEPLIDARRYYRITVKHYHKMLENGLISEGPFELLDGQIVRKLRSALGEDPMTINPGHSNAVKALVELAPAFIGRGCHLMSQQPISLPPRNEPEPDLTIVRGKREDYANRHPGAGDVLCVIEVASASLIDDRTRKQRIYAQAGLPLYLIVNLVDHVVEAYSQPSEGSGRYSKLMTLQLKDKLTLPTAKGKGVVVSVRKLFP